jgi:hypothetical protein
MHIDKAYRRIRESLIYPSLTEAYGCDWMDWKITVLGIAAILLLLTAFSTTNVVFGYVAEHIKVTIPVAELTDVTMYGAAYQNTEGQTPAIYQEISTMGCTQGQIINRTMIVGPPYVQRNVKIIALLTMEKVTMSGVKIYAWNLTSSSGTLNGVTMTAEAFPMGVVQHIDSATMYDLETFIWQVIATKIVYEGLTIKIIVEPLA